MVERARRGRLWLSLKETHPPMKKLMTVLMGLSFLVATSTAVFASDDKKEEPKKEEKKKGKKKKAPETEEKKP
jgi:hypothetical protein